MVSIGLFLKHCSFSNLNSYSFIAGISVICKFTMSGFAFFYFVNYLRKLLLVRVIGFVVFVLVPFGSFFVFFKRAVFKSCMVFIGFF